MSEDKKEKIKKSPLYFLKGSKPAIIWDVKKSKALIKAKNGLFVTKSKRISRILTEKGYELISAKSVKKG